MSITKRCHLGGGRSTHLLGPEYTSHNYKSLSDKHSYIITQEPGHRIPRIQ